MMKSKSRKQKTCDKKQKPMQCDVCGQFVSYDETKTLIKFVTPDSEYSMEEYEILCHKHKNL